MQYVPSLEQGRILEASKQTHAIWAGSRTKRQHGAHTLEQIARAGPELLRYVGLVDRSGLVASLKRFALALRHPKRGVLRAVGLGAVFTREDRRGEGHAAELVRTVLREAEDHGYGAAFLFSDIAPAYYARLGFVELAASDFVVATSDLPGRAPLETRPAADADTDRLLRLYEAAGRASKNVFVARSRASWRFFRHRNRAREHVLLERGREVGYVMAGKVDPLRDMRAHRPRTLWVDEWSAPAIAPARVWATIRRLAEDAGATKVAGWISEEARRKRFGVQPRSDCIPMVAPLGGWSLDPGDAFLNSFDHF